MFSPPPSPPRRRGHIRCCLPVVSPLHDGIYHSQKKNSSIFYCVCYPQIWSSFSDWRRQRQRQTGIGGSSSNRAQMIVRKGRPTFHFQTRATNRRGQPCQGCARGTSEGRKDVRGSRIEWRERRGSSNERERARTGAAPAMSLAAFGRPNWERRRSRNGKCHATTAGRATVRPPGTRPNLRKGSNGRLMSKLYSAPLLMDGLGSSSH